MESQGVEEQKNKFKLENLSGTPLRLRLSNFSSSTDGRGMA
jgi:hypothetical protein